VDEVAAPLGDHEPRIAQNAQMLRDSGGGDPQRPGERAHAHRVPLEEGEHPHPRLHRQGSAQARYVFRSTGHRLMFKHPRKYFINGPRVGQGRRGVVLPSWGPAWFGPVVHNPCAMGDGTCPRRAFVLNGSDSPGDMPDRISAALARYLLDRGWHADRMDVHTAQIGMCRVCNACAFKTPGECALRDDGRDVPRLMAQSDLFAFVSGIRFGGYPAAAKRALERTLPNVHPLFMVYRGEMHHRLRYAHRPYLVFVGWQPFPDAEARCLYTRLTERNAINFQADHRTVVLEGDLAPEALDRELAELVGEGIR